MPVVKVVARRVAVQIFVYAACRPVVDDDLQMLVNLVGPQYIGPRLFFVTSTE